MSDTIYPNTGTLWKNTEKKSPDSPEMSGNFTDATGAKRKLYGRVARDRETGEVLRDSHGNTYLRIKVGELMAAAPPPKPAREEMDDEIPF